MSEGHVSNRGKGHGGRWCHSQGRLGRTASWQAGEVSKGKLFQLRIVQFIGVVLVKPVFDDS